MSVFRDDGYFDAKNGKRPSPPDKYTDNDGCSTNVFAIEYEEGYKEGVDERNRSNDGLACPECGCLVRRIQDDGGTRMEHTFNCRKRKG